MERLFEEIRFEKSNLNRYHIIMLPVVFIHLAIVAINHYLYKFNMTWLEPLLELNIFHAQLIFYLYFFSVMYCALARKESISLVNSFVGGMYLVSGVVYFATTIDVGYGFIMVITGFDMFLKAMKKNEARFT